MTFPIIFVPRVLAPVLIPGGTGSVIGDMTANGGLAAAFDGELTEVWTADMAGDTSGDSDANVGKDWGSGVTKIITRFRVSFQGSGGSGPYGTTSASATLTLQGSSDGSSWTTLYTHSSSIAGDNGSIIDVATGITVTTAYRYHRVRLVGSSGGLNTYLAEVEFYEDG